MDTNRIITGDSLDVLPDLPEESVHAVVTDPPYGLAFMGRDWDDFEPREYQQWCENWARRAKRVLKPGGHLLAFSGNRTHHRLFAGVEDAGFEIRDTLTWHYGSGFPKAADVSKVIDKRADAEREVVRENPNKRNTDSDKFNSENRVVDHTAPATDAAKKWDGWKTGLKPATEYVVMARKPFDGATVNCVQEHGTGALNIGACRVDSVTEEQAREPISGLDEGDGVALEGSVSEELNTEYSGVSTDGRYPSNVVFDETAAADLDEQVGELDAGAHTTQVDAESANCYGDKRYLDAPDERTETDSGGPSRYFYTSKASKSERTNGGEIANSHPTVKPVDLMEWLVRLVTRQGQIVLDPFAGSGTTCLAAKNEHREFVGIEQLAQWADVARARAGLTPNDPAHVRPDDAQTGLGDY